MWPACAARRPRLSTVLRPPSPLSTAAAHILPPKLLEVANGPCRTELSARQRDHCRGDQNSAPKRPNPERARADLSARGRPADGRRVGAAGFRRAAAAAGFPRAAAAARLSVPVLGLDPVTPRRALR